ncbi:MAG TPA: YdcF family protein [Rhodocyclaceae bacterium]|nr:YdcF family protein [Rhodocyclaceae bacterium]
MAMDPAIALFWLKKITAALVLPPLGPLLLVALGLLALRRHRRGGLALAWGGLALALALSTPASVGWLLRGLEPDAAVGADALRRAEAIVILGGGKREHAPEYGGQTVNRLTLERLRYGARLARATGLPILVSGGARSGPPEAELMREVLERDFGTRVRWIESSARDTRQNAQFAAVHLRAAGVRRIALVTHAVHVPRAKREFEAQGFEVIAAPTAWFGGPDGGEPLVVELPGATTAFAGWIAAHEWLGRLAYRLSR